MHRDVSGVQHDNAIASVTAGGYLADPLRVPPAIFNPIRAVATNFDNEGLVPSYWNAIPASSPDAAGRSAFGDGNVS